MIKEIEPTISPKTIIWDFEFAVFSAIKEIFPKGCFFHHSQNMQKHIATFGITSYYNNDSKFSIFLFFFLFFPRNINLNEFQFLVKVSLDNELD